MQDVLSDDELVPLVGEKRGREDDNDPIFATGTETGTRDENQNENGNGDGTRIQPEVQEEESGPASPEFNQARKPPARVQRTGKSHQKRSRIIVTKHPIFEETQRK